MSTNDNALHTALCAENAVLRGFIGLLRDAQQLLLKGKSDSLGALVEPQARMLFELVKLGERRQQFLRDRGMSADRAGMEQLLREHHAHDSPESTEWRLLLQLAADANQINACNGLLIAARTKSTQRALSTLFSAARLPSAYAPDGRTVGFRSAQQLAVA